MITAAQHAGDIVQGETEIPQGLEIIGPGFGDSASDGDS